MSVTGKAALGLAALALAAGAGLAAAPPAGAATTACGTGCMTLFNQDFGNGYVAAVAGGIPVTGATVRLSAAAASRAEDFQLTDKGNTADLAAQGLVSPEVGTLFGREGNLMLVNGMVKPTICLPSLSVVMDMRASAEAPG